MEIDVYPERRRIKAFALTMEGFMPFGEKLRRLREKSSLSQSGLAAKTKLSIRSIQNWEQGVRQPSAAAILTLASALGVTSEILLRELDAKPNGRRRGKA